MRTPLRESAIDSWAANRFLNGLEQFIQRISIVLPGSRRLKFGTERGGVYRPGRRDAGFFSQCTTTLADLMSLALRAKRVVSRGAFESYRVLPGVNSWSRFFAEPPRRACVTKECHETRDRITPALQHSRYPELDFACFQPYMKRYFQPSLGVVEKKQELKQRYRIVADQLIAVNIRGTDKWKEVSAPPLENFVEWAKEALRLEPSAQVLLVTDDSGVANRFRAAFPAPVMMFSELPMSSRTSNAVHRDLARSQREKFAVDFLATVHIMSSAKFLITHTGNVGLWSALFRGHPQGLVQLDDKKSFGSLATD